VDSAEADSAAVVLAAVTSAVFVADRVRMVFGGSIMNSFLFDMRPLVKHIAPAACMLLLTSSMVSCSKSQSPQVAQKSFASPEEASAALLESAKTGDENSLLAIFGPAGKSLFSSGDSVKDKDTLQDFVAAYNQMHRWREIKAGGEMLYVGADNFIFPVPLGKNSSGQWLFDTAAGEDEILARRIGKDELTAIAACLAIVNAQRQYFSQVRDGDKMKQYAEKFVSDEGKQNGLYWPVAAGQAPSPFEDVRDFAKAAGYASAGDQPQPFDGYYFRILKKQGSSAKGGAKNYIVAGKMTGGFAMVAYPAEYRNSGIMTFLVGPDGIVYQKDLGADTTALGKALTDYDPSEGWSSAI
jgi:hypothetical protein